jgi:tetratricopeptide (TPR) repeat protein
MDSVKKRRIEIVIYLSLCAACLVVYLQLINCDFVNYDDELYLTKNPYIQAGITLKNVIWAFTTGYASNWHPLTWLSHMLDFKLYGLNPMGHHWTNLQIHIANTLLLFFVLQHMTGAILRSAFVSALFAVHPLHVESVAWIAERKDVLCTFFWILCMYAYVGYVRNPKKKRWYILLIILFPLGLMAKPMIVTLPFVLLLLDFWPLSRFQSIIHEQKINVFQAFKTLVWEKTPLFVLTAISCVITFFVQQHGGAVASIQALPLKARAVNAIVSYTSYIGKMIWPSHLAVLYPFREWNPGQVLISGVLLLLISTLAVRTWHRHPYFFVGWLWYLGTLIPAIGLVQVGAQRMADRYTYIPLIGLFIIIAWAMPDILSKWRDRRIVLGTISGVMIILFMICSWFQVHHWKNGATLFTHAVKTTNNNSIAYCELGHALNQHGKRDEAIINLLRSLEINPYYAEAHFELGVTLEAQGNCTAAVKQYLEALRINPNHVKAHNSLGIILAKQGNFKDSVYHYKKALQINPEYPGAYYNLGKIFSAQGKIEEAIFYYQKALYCSSNMTQALYNLSWILATCEDGNYRNGTEAVKLAERLCRITRYKQPLALDALAAAYAETGKFDAAVLTAKKGLKLALNQGPEELALALRKRLQLYQTKHSYGQNLREKNAS